MPKEGYFAVRKGRVAGIYRKWDECEDQVKGFPGAVFKKFNTLAEAQAFIGEAETLASILQSKISVASIPPSPNESEWKSIYTDGACQGNGRAGSVAGVGVWFGDNNPGNISERCPGEQTNNRAELIAIIRALESTARSEKVIVKTDSTYCRDCIEQWLPKWRLNGFRTANGQPVKNLPLILYLSELLSAKPARTFRFEKVPAHTGIHGNECADGLAGAGCELPWRPERDDEWSLDKVAARQETEPSTPEEVQPSPPVPSFSAGRSAVDLEAFSPDDVLSAEELAAELGE